MSAKRETRSPIKDLPVRLPGTSIRDRQDRILFDKFLIPAMAAGLFVLAAWLQWSEVLFKTRPMPWTFSIFAVIAIGVAIWKGISAFREITQLRLGRVGEEAVGQFLEEKLRPLECQVLHDIPFEGFNIDHVVIGPTGVYTIETKTCSKPVKGQANVRYDGQTVTVDGFKPDRDPVIQAKANAHSICDLIERSTGRKFPTRGVVLYPGWYVEGQQSGGDVWVLNEKALPTFISNAKTILAPEDVSLITFHLKRYVISETEKAAAKL